MNNETTAPAKVIRRPIKHSPPPTGNLPEFFAGSMFNATLDERVAVTVEPEPPPPTPPELFDGVKNTGRSISGTQAFLSKNKE